MKTKYLFGGRGSGISTSLLTEAIMYNKALLVPTQSQAKLYKQRATLLGWNNLIIWSVSDIIAGKHRGTRCNGILIDNADFVLKQLLNEWELYESIDMIGINLE